jgi:hypothetical protein
MVGRGGFKMSGGSTANLVLVPRSNDSNGNINCTDSGTLKLLNITYYIKKIKNVFLYFTIENCDDNEVILHTNIRRIMQKS